MSCALWDRNGGLVWECRSNGSGRLSRSRTGSHVWHPAARICVRLPLGYRFLSSPGGHDIAWLETVVLVRSLSTHPHHSLSTMFARDTVLSPTRGRARSHRQSYKHLYRRGKSGLEETLASPGVFGIVDGGIQLYGTAGIPTNARIQR